MKRTLTDGITVEVADEKYAKMKDNEEVLICITHADADGTGWIEGPQTKVLIILARVFIACMKRVGDEVANIAFTYITAELTEDLKERIKKRETEENNND